MGAKKTKRTGPGRPKGSPNRRSQEVLDYLCSLQAEGLACDPIEFLARVVANDFKALGLKKPLGITVRVKAAIELAPYVAPKRKAVEVKIVSKTPIKLKWPDEAP